MTASFTHSDIARPALAVLREATDDLHQKLHMHQRIVDLLTCPSLDTYEMVLQSLLAFYRPLEPVLIECCQRFGDEEQYAQPLRTQQLVADLEALNRGSDRLAVMSEHVNVPELETRGALVGCLYVIKGSALGGEAILERIGSRLPIEHSRRFLTNDGGRTQASWCAFHAYCEQICHTVEARRDAVQTAQQTFESIAECLGMSLD